MTKEMIVKAWKDSEFANTLTPEQQALVASQPAGALEDLEEAQIEVCQYTNTIGRVCE